MKKIFLAGLCGMLLLGSANQSKALSDEAKTGLVFAGVVGSVAVIAKPLGRYISYRCEKNKYEEVQRRYFKLGDGIVSQILDVLEKIGTSGFNHRDAVREIVKLFSLKKYKSHEALKQLDKLTGPGVKKKVYYNDFDGYLRFYYKKANSLIDLSDSFRKLSERGVFFKKESKVWLQKINKMIKDINEIASIIERSFAYNSEKLEQERPERERREKAERDYQFKLLQAERQHRVEFVKAQNPATNEFGLKLSQG